MTDPQVTLPGYSFIKDGVIDLTAGTIGGIANVYAGQPLDTVKVKMQTFPSFYKNWIGCFLQTLKVDGVSGLYAGTVPALAANIAENAVLFTAYGFCQKFVGAVAGIEDSENMKPLPNAFAGSLAAVFAAGVLCPTELVKCRLQTQLELHPQSKDTLYTICRDILRERRISLFFTGMSATLAREVPGYFVFFGAYELTRYLFTHEGQRKSEIGTLRTALSGAMGGMAFWTLCFPFDVIKSRMQVTGEGTFSSTFLNVLRNDGFLAFYKGLTPTLIRTCSASGCLFIAYENTKRFLHSF